MLRRLSVSLGVRRQGAAHVCTGGRYSAPVSSRLTRWRISLDSLRHGANYLSHLSLARTCSEGSLPPPTPDPAANPNPSRGCFIQRPPATASIGAPVHVTKRAFQVWIIALISRDQTRSEIEGGTFLSTCQAAQPLLVWCAHSLVSLRPSDLGVGVCPSCRLCSGRTNTPLGEGFSESSGSRSWPSVSPSTCTDIASGGKGVRVRPRALDVQLVGAR